MHTLMKRGRTMEVIRAEAMGMCFGVRDALEVIEGIDRPDEVTVLGELVHNPVVIGRLDARGFGRVSEAEREEVATAGVLITAHGVSDARRARLEGAGKRLIDTTCPLVERVHRAARGLEAQGYFVLVVGKPGHVEVQGIVEDLTKVEVVPSAEDVRNYGEMRLGIVCQTTTPERTVRAIREAVASHNPDADEIRFVDTVCRPTKQRQRAMETLLEQVQAVVVVGGRNSNNTRELVRLCEERGLRAWHVEGPSDLEPEWFEGIEKVGLTAGTSTLEETIDAVEDALTSIR
jgi:4-hydroxy-3-methylbut-2-enyl diphosphate reductase